MGPGGGAHNTQDREVEPLPPRWGDTGLTVILTAKFLPTRMRKKPSNTKSTLLLLRIKAKWVKGQVPKAAQVTGERAPHGQQSLNPNRPPHGCRAASITAQRQGVCIPRAPVRRNSRGAERQARGTAALWPVCVFNRGPQALQAQARQTRRGGQSRVPKKFTPRKDRNA